MTQDSTGHPPTSSPTLARRLALIASILLPVTAILLLTLHLLRDREVAVAYRQHQIAVEQVLASYARQLSLGFGEVVTDLEIIAHSPSLHSYLALGTPESRATLAKTFAIAQRSSGRYDQIRFIDAMGMERVRVNYQSGNPTVVPDDQLQDKRGRYYFTDMVSLPPESIYVSPLDLNIERGVVEQPLKPMVRIGSPLYDTGGVFRGIILLNLLGDVTLRTLDSFPTETLGGLSLLNDDGYWLYDSEQDRTWGFMLPERSGMTFSNSVPKAAPTVYAADTGSIVADQGLVTFATVYPLNSHWNTSKGSPVAWHMSQGLIEPSRYFWKLVCLTPPEVIEASIAGIERSLFLMGLLVELAAALTLWSLSGSILRRKEAEQRLREANEQLEATIHVRTRELNRANERLTREMESLRNAEEAQTRLVAAIDHAEDSVVITDPEGTILYTNPAFSRITGYSPEEALGQNPRILKSGRHDDAYYRIFWDTIISGKVWKGTMVNKKKSGALYEEEMSVAPVLNAEGSIMNFVAVKADVSRRVSLERAQSFFTSVTSHELRTPLTKLQLARLLLEQGDENGRVQALTIIGETYAEFDRLVNATGTLSRLLLGEKARLASTNLAAVVGACVGSARDGVKKNNRQIALSLAIEGNIEWVSIPCDQELLALAIDEVLSNAIKFSPDRSSVAITLSSDKAAGTVTLTIQDRGIGINEEELGFIRSPFFSFVDPTTYQSGRYSQGGGGIGIGLTLADLIVERHGGNLHIASNTKGAGTIVTITLSLTGPR